MSSRLIAAQAAAVVLAFAAPLAAQAQTAVPPYVAAAVAEPSRPETDRARDAARKPAEMLAFAGVKPGDKVLELIPSGGYFTRVLAKAVGPTGRVYAAEARRTGSPPGPLPMQKLASEDPGYANIVSVEAKLAQPIAAPEPVDMVWTAQNYHDFHLAGRGLDVASIDKQLYDALKPGGTLIVIDHAAVAGAPLNVADSLHRIDPAKVRTELEAAGFKFEGESQALRNPADPKTGNVFDAAIRGKTDQFVYKFRKPAV
jgi:predicted methyltransferase